MQEHMTCASLETIAIACERIFDIIRLVYTLLPSLPNILQMNQIEWIGETLPRILLKRICEFYHVSLDW